MADRNCTRPRGLPQLLLSDAEAALQLPQTGAL
jgi:hypothetical protein